MTMSAAKPKPIQAPFTFHPKPSGQTSRSAPLGLELLLAQGWISLYMGHLNWLAWGNHHHG
jgi:hypothetical protein